MPRSHNQNWESYINSKKNKNPVKQVVPDNKYLLKLAKTKMPFGKYSGRYLVDLPEPYVTWFAQKGFPEGELGEMLQSIYEIKANGLEFLLKPLRNI